MVDAMRSASMAWESILTAVIQNCFAKCGFGTASSVNADDDENCECVELQDHNNCPCTFSEFLNVDKSVPTTVDQPTSLDGPGLAPSTR
jgi:hypothetical protein